MEYWPRPRHRGNPFQIFNLMNTAPPNGFAGDADNWAGLNLCTNSLCHRVCQHRVQIGGVVAQNLPTLSEDGCFLVTPDLLDNYKEEGRSVAVAWSYPEVQHVESRLYSVRKSDHSTAQLCQSRQQDQNDGLKPRPNGTFWKWPRRTDRSRFVHLDGRALL